VHLRGAHSLFVCTLEVHTGDFMKYILAIDLGGTKIAVGIVDLKGKVLAKLVEPTQIRSGPKGVIRQIIRMSKDLFAKIRDQICIDSRVVGVGIGAPGPLKPAQGIIISPPNLPGWKNVQLVRPIRQAFKAPVFLDNDANAAALGEWMFGAGIGTKNMVYFTISTGIGAGVIINGCLYHGQFAAGELGHMVIDPDGPKCSCGSYGCLEAFSSGTAIAREAKKAPKNSLLWKLCKGGTLTLDASLVFRAAERKDKFAQEVLSRALVALGIGMVNTIHTFHPDKIVLGGGMMKEKKHILPFLREFTQKKVMPAFRKNIKIQAAKLGQDAGLFGAAALVITKSSPISI